MSLLSRMRGVFPPGLDPAPSPVTAEKDEAVAIARRIIQSGGNVSVTEGKVMARQLLRALALPVSAP